MKRCEASRIVAIETKADGDTGIDGKPGSLRSVQCRKAAATTMGGVSLCVVHAGMFVCYGEVELTDSRALTRQERQGETTGGAARRCGAASFAQEQP